MSPLGIFFPQAGAQPGCTQMARPWEGFHISPALEALAHLWGPPWCWSLGCGWHQELTDLAVQPPRPLAHPVCSAHERPRGEPSTCPSTGRARAALPALPAVVQPLWTQGGLSFSASAGLGCPGGAHGKEPACIYPKL